MNPTFDHARFFATIDAIRESQSIESIPKLAKKLGVPDSALYALRDGKGVTWDNVIKIVAWSKIDLRAYIVQGPA